MVRLFVHQTQDVATMFALLDHNHPDAATGIWSPGPLPLPSEPTPSSIPGKRPSLLASLSQLMLLSFLSAAPTDGLMAFSHRWG